MNRRDFFVPLAAGVAGIAAGPINVVMAGQGKSQFRQDVEKARELLKHCRETFPIKKAESEWYWDTYANEQEVNAYVQTFGLFDNSEVYIFPSRIYFVFGPSSSIVITEKT